MDPISASNYNLSRLRSDDDESQIPIIADKNHLTSLKSLSNYEEKNFKNLLPQLLAAAIATFGHVSVGMSLAYSAILIPQLEADDSDIKVTKTQTSWIASVLVLVGPLGSLISAYLMDRVGRMNALKLSAIPTIIGWTLIATAQSVPFIIVGRLIAGLSASVSTGPAVVYITEIARKDMRGSLLSFGPTFASLGMMIVYLKGWFLHWRTVAWLGNLYVVVPFLCLFLIPESPAWLVSRDRHEDAKSSLRWLHRHQREENMRGDMQLEVLLGENDRKQKLDSTRQGGESVFRAFLEPTGFKPMLILSGLFFFQQFSGIYIFQFYSVSFFSAVGTSVNPYAASLVLGLIRFMMSLGNTYILKNCNRRLLLMFSCSGMALSILTSGTLTYLMSKPDNSIPSWAPAVFLLLYVITSMTGLLPIPWTMTAEMFTIRIRSTAHSLAISVANLVMFAAIQSYASMMVLLGGSAGVQVFFAVISAIAVLYVWLFVPETHGKKLTEIEDYFRWNWVFLGSRRCERRRRVEDRFILS